MRVIYNNIRLIDFLNLINKDNYISIIDSKNIYYAFNYYLDTCNKKVSDILKDKKNIELLNRNIASVDFKVENTINIYHEQIEKECIKICLL